MNDTDRTQAMLAALRHRHMADAGNGSSKQWVYADEVRVSTGWGGWNYYRTGESTPSELLGSGEQRIDAYAMNTWPSKKGLRIAYEVKASTQDLKKELADHSKSVAARFLSNEFYLVVHQDAKLLLSDVPDEWGVIRFKDSLRTVRKATHRDTPLPPYSFMLSLARNLQARSLRAT